MKHTTLQKARDVRNLKNAEIARMVGCSESMVCKVMSGEKKRGKVREKIVNLFTKENHSAQG